MLKNRSLLLLAALVAISGSQVVAKEGGVFTAGDIWESFLPSNAGAFYSETADDVTDLADLFRVGNWDRQWTTSSMSYPGGENIHLPWGQDLQITEYSPNPINTITTSTAPNAANYAHGVYTSSLNGAGDANRDWTTDGAVWTDADRDEMRYEGGMPTTLGVDVNWRMRQFTANHGHLNDFIIVELELTNTGVLDVNGDGFVTSNDVVILINEINRQVGSGAEAEGSVNVIDDPFGRLDFPAPTFESFRIKEDMPLRRGEVTVRRDFAAIVSATRASAVQSSNLQARLMPAQRASETDELESLLELLAADLVSQQEVGL